MALKLDCTMCAASLVADDLAIRRGMATCQYCGTLLRITPKGTEAYQDEIEQRPLPPGFTVTHTPPDLVSITVPRSKSAGIVINKPEITKGLKIGIGITVAVSGFILLFGIFLALIFSPEFGLGFIPISCTTFFLLIIPAVLVSILVVSAMQKTLPTLTIQGNIIHPAVMGSAKLQKKEIKQIYAAVTQLNTGQGQSLTTTMVYALTENGKRVPLLGPVGEAETGLQLEELIEVELGIFNLPVYGDADLPRQTDVAQLDSPSVPQPMAALVCDYCGAGLQETPEARKRGFLVCEHCTGLTLLYEPGGERPVLGLPEENLPAGQYRVEHNEKRLAIFSAGSSGANAIVTVDEAQLHTARLGGAVQTLALADIAKFQVREITEEPTGGSDIANAVNVFKFLGTLKESMAYSGEVDPQKMLLNTFGISKYQLIARMKDGRDYWLIKTIDDPREALFLAKTLEKVCQS